MDGVAQKWNQSTATQRPSLESVKEPHCDRSEKNPASAGFSIQLKLNQLARVPTTSNSTRLFLARP